MPLFNIILEMIS